MQFSFLALVTLATATNATFFNRGQHFNQYSPSAPITSTGLSNCQAACVAAAMPKLGSGSYALGKTAVSKFCAQPSLQSWYTANVGPCKTTCDQSRPSRVYSRTFNLKGLVLIKGSGSAGLSWLQRTCPYTPPATQNQGYGNEDSDATVKDDDNNCSPPAQYV